MTYSPVGGIKSTGNSTTTPLSGAATFTGTYELVTNYASITVKASADVPGTMYVDFSNDGIASVDTMQLSDGLDGSLGFHNFVPGSSYFRVRVINGASAQSSFVLETLYYRGAKVSIPTSRLESAITQYTDTLNVRQVNDPTFDTARGKVTGRYTVHKFGANPTIAASSTEAVTFGGTINFLTSATTVRIKAGGNAGDTAAGSGARSVIVIGLDSNWEEVSEVIVTAGASASSATTTSFIRVYRAYVVDVGLYATATNTAGFNLGDITIENSSGGTDLITIAAGRGQSEYSGYTVPADHTAYLVRMWATPDSSKAVTVTMYQRENADDASSAPYTGKRLVLEFQSITGSVSRDLISYIQFPAKTDIWWNATTGSGATAACSVEYDLILLDTP